MFEGQIPDYPEYYSLPLPVYFMFLEFFCGLLDLFYFIFLNLHSASPAAICVEKVNEKCVAMTRVDRPELLFLVQIR